MLNQTGILNDVIIRREKNLSQMRFNLPNKLNATADLRPENYQSMPLDTDVIDKSTQRSISLLKQAATAKKT